MTSRPSTPLDGTAGAPPGGDDHVHLRMLVIGGMPLIVAGIGEHGSGARLRERLAEAGLVQLTSFLGVDLPRGARVGFVLDGDELRLVDERDDALLRAPRAGVDEDWLEAARRLRGTMTVVVTGLVVDGETPPRELADAVDDRARAGGALGAIVGVVEERPSLPLIF